MDTSLSTKQNFLPKPFGIANHEQLAFVKLDRREQVRIIDLLGAFRTIAEFDGKRGEAFASVAACNGGRDGFSVKSLERHYYKYIKSGYDWTILVRNWRGDKPGQPKEFLDFLGKLVSECNGRTDVSGGVYDRLFHEFWAAGKAVPGYGTFKSFWDATQPDKQYPSRIRPRKPFVPQGWSRGNIGKLIAKIAPRRGALRLRAAFGELRAHDAEAQVRRDMSNLKPMQLVTMDDVELDIQVMFKIGPHMRIRTAQAVVAMDVATRMIIGWGVRPIYTDKDVPFIGDTDGKTLTRKDVNAVLLNTILTHGLPANYPMRLLMENNSARLNTLDREMLFTMLPGRFVIENTRMAKREYLGSSFKDEHGFPFQKGWLESGFKPLHIRLCHLPGATAPRFDDRHSVHKAITEYCEKLEKLAVVKHVDMDKLKYPVLTEDEFFKVFARIVEMFNSRTNHKLQGFDTVYECLLPDGEFCRRECLPDTLSADQLGDLDFFARPESPFERWAKLRAENEFTSVPAPALYPCLCDKRAVKVRNGEIKTEISAFSRDPLYFRAPILRDFEGREFIAAFTPDHKTAWLFNQNEGFVCEAPRVDYVDITDQTAIIRQSGIVYRDRQIEVERLAAFHADRDNLYKEIRVHNAEILAENEAVGTAMAKREETVRNRDRASKISQDTAIENLGDMSDVPAETDGLDAVAALESFTENQ